MAASVDLTTLVAAKLKLGISGTSDDTYIGGLIDEASERIEEHCDRQFLLQQYTEYFSAEDCPDGIIIVSSPPINKNSAALVRTKTDIGTYVSVYEDTERLWASGADVDESNIYVLAQEGVIRSAIKFTSGDLMGAIKATYYGGYATIPTSVADACKEQVALWYNRDKNAAWGKASESEGGASVTYTQHGDLAPQVIAKLHRYVRDMT